MSRTSPRSGRGASSRTGRGLKVGIAVLLAFVAILVLNAIALDNETEQASVPPEGMSLVETTSGPLQVLDTGPPANPVIPNGADAAISPVPGPAADGVSPAPLVLIHGSGGAINWWDQVVPLFKAGHRVVAIDMLGYGGSAKPDSDYSVETQSGLISQVLAKLGVERAVVVGHSLGGFVATALAESSPALVSGVVLVDSPPDSTYGGISGTAKAITIPLVGQVLWRITPDSLIRKNLEQAFAPGFDVPEMFVDDIRAMTFPAYRKSLDSGGEFADSDPLNERLRRTGVPLLVIFGEVDQIIPARESISAYATVPGVETLLMPEIGHSPQVEAPAQTAAAIEKFTAGLAPPEPPSNAGQKPQAGQGAPDKSKQNSNSKQKSKQKQNSKQKSKQKQKQKSG